MDTPVAGYDPDTQPYHQTAPEISTLPSLQFLRAVAELLEAEPDTLLTEMGYAPDEVSRTKFDEAFAAW